MTSAAPPLPVLLLSDGRPGHYNLSEGIVAAIARRRTVAITRMDVRRGRWPGQLLAAMTRLGVSPGRILMHVYGVDATLVAPHRLVVSAGAETLAANIAIARLLRARNIFYGSLRGFRASDFSLALTSYAVDASAPNQRMVLKPANFDPDRLRSVATEERREPSVAALLIGGDAGDIRFGDDDWTRLIDFLTAAHRDQGTRWVVSNSRRTPTTVSDRLAGLARAPAGPLADFIDVRRAQAAGIETILDRADAVLCTADSSSMLSECVWARRPVLAVSPATYSLVARETDYRRYIADNGWSRTLPIGLLTPATWRASLGQIMPYAGNAQDDLSVLLAHRLPELFAPQRV